MSVLPIDNRGEPLKDSSAAGAEGSGGEPVTASEPLGFVPGGPVSEGSVGLLALRPDVDWKVDTAVVPALRRDLYAPQRFAYTAAPQQRFVYVPVPPQRAARPMRRPAPFVLRILVSLLAALLVASALGLAAFHVRPAWLATLKKDLHAHHAVAAATVAKPAVPSPVRFGLVSARGTTRNYSVPAASYSITLAIDHPDWVVVKSPPSAPSPLLAKTLLPNEVKPLAITGDASVVVSARTQSITITSNGRVIGVINSPTLGTTYTFLAKKG